MNLTTIALYAAVSVTIASALVTLASMFGGKAARTVQTAGLALMGAAATIVMIQTTTTIPKSGIEGIGWLVSLPDDTLTAMFIVGAVLLVLGSLFTLLNPVKTYAAYRSSTSIIGHRPQRFSGRMIKRELRSFGQRRSTDQRHMSEKND